MKDNYLFTHSKRMVLTTVIAAMALLFSVNHEIQAQNILVSDTLTESGTFTVPPNVTSVTVKVWGAGAGGGQGAGRSWSAAGGGGGGFSQSTLSVNPLDGISYTIGTGGTGGGQQFPGMNGGASDFGGWVIALGGSAPVGEDGGIGAAIGTGDITFEGGSGDVRVSNFIGGGAGSSAGDAGDGGDADGQDGGVPNGFGGNGGDGGSNFTIGQNGFSPGGGGGGKGGGQNVLSGDGADGLIVVNYEIPPVELDCPANTVFTACLSETQIEAEFSDWLDQFTFTGGCWYPTESFDGAPSAEGLGNCATGSVEVTYRVESDCEEDKTCTRTFTVVESTVDVVEVSSQITSACDYNDQDAVDSDFANWLNGFDVSGGCDPQFTVDPASPEAPDLCGGSTTVTWTVTDDCYQTTTHTATFTITPAPAVQVTAVQDATSSACDYADQAAVDAAFDAWLDGFEVSGGCNPQFSTDPASPEAPAVCGGSTTVTWTVTDHCYTTSTHSATFAVTPAPAVDVTEVANDGDSACNFADQDAADAAFAAWLGGFAVDGGCDPQFSTDPASPEAPDFCGGSTTVTWTVTDHCYTTSTHTATFTIDEPAPLTYDGPQDAERESCDFADQDAVDLDYSDWIDAQTAAIAASFDGGCDPQVNVSSQPAAPALCDGGTVTVVWTISDHCFESVNVSAEYSLEEPEDLTFDNPQDASRESCDFDSQEEVNDNFADWVADQTAAIAASFDGGCVPQVEVTMNEGAPDLCAGGTSAVTWTITDDICFDAVTVNAVYTLNPPATVVYGEPENANRESCNFADQAAVDADFDDWVAAQTAAIEADLDGGCEPEVNVTDNPGAPALCEGGTVTVEWTVTDKICLQPVVLTATYTLVAPDAISYDSPEGDNRESCEFADQSEVDAAIAAWVAAETDRIKSNLAGGCDPQVTNNYVDQSVMLCEGGSVTITWNIDDLCENLTETATWILTEPDAISYDSPKGDDRESCEFVDQVEVDAVIAAWVATQTDRIESNLAGGCDPQVTNNYVDQSVVLCEGGSVTITWSIDDLCENLTETATWTLTKPDAITYDEPNNDERETCEFSEQSEVDAAIAAWVAAETDRIEANLAGGCDPQVTNNYVDQSVVLCEGGSVTITWNIDDLCENLTETATWTLEAPDDISYDRPNDGEGESCVLGSQVAVDAAIAAWVAAETDRIESSLEGGCYAVVTNDFVDQSIVLCEGGSVTITWSIDDLCENLTETATWTLIAPDAISYTKPEGDDRASCEFADQDGVDNAIAEWVTLETNRIENSLTGGCAAEVTALYQGQSVVLCEGGSVTITWLIDDLCESFTETATWSLTAPVAISYIAPEGDDRESCDFADQDAVDAAIAAWVNAETDRIESSLEDGCAPQVSNNYEAQSVVLCEGGSVTITWSIDDLCENFTETATWSLTAPDAVEVTQVQDRTIESCNDQSFVDAEYADWLAGFSATGGCDPQVEVTEGDAPDFCGSVTTVSWVVTDLCFEQNYSATFTVTAPDPISYEDPADENVNSCDFEDQEAVNAAFAQWIADQTAAIQASIEGGCDPIATADGSVANLMEPIVSMSRNSNTDFYNAERDRKMQERMEVRLARFGGELPLNLGTSRGSCVDPGPGVDTEGWEYMVIITADSYCCNVEFDFFCEMDYEAYLEEGVLACQPPTGDVDQTSAEYEQVINENPECCIEWTEGCQVAYNALVGDPIIYEAPILCEGGSTTVTWTINDACETITGISATFTLTAPEAIEFTAPVGYEATECQYQTQEAADDAFTQWVADQTTALEESIEGGCDPVVTNDWDGESTVAFCGGELTVTWTITDLCETITELSATFSIDEDVTAPVLEGEVPGEDFENLHVNDRPDAPSVEAIAALFTDNCGNVNVDYQGEELVIDGCDFIWTSTYTYLVFDDCGNEYGVVEVINTSIDTEAPEFLEGECDQIDVEVPLGLCELILELDTPEATDNCEVESTVGQRDDELSLTDPFPVGVTVITWTATDPSGNFTTCEQTVLLYEEQRMRVDGNHDIEIDAGETEVSPLVGTKFGSVSLGGVINRTFTITNIGCLDLDLTNDPAVVLEGDSLDLTMFSVSTQPAETTLEPGESTTFTVTYVGTEYGVDTVTASIANNDITRDPFEFRLEAATSPAVMQVRGNSINIPDGDIFPVLSNFTDFGTFIWGNGRTRTFTIHNLGVQTLELDGSPRVELLGDDADMFEVITQPAATVPPGGNRSFRIRFVADAVGVFNATVSIDNSDLGRDPYTFTVQATVNEPSMTVFGLGNEVENGSTTPEVSNNTDFGAITEGTTKSHVFQISNSGSGRLALTGSPLVDISGADAGQFEVTLMPASLINNGSSAIFRIEYQPTAPGSHEALVTIENNDPNNDPYTFVIAGDAVMALVGGDMNNERADRGQADLSMIAYPNPARNQVFVEAPESMEEYELSVFSLEGRLFRTVQTTGGLIEMDIADWAPGVYIIRANGQDVAPIRFIRMD